jgi:diacylglycerol kinase (ATP)
LNDTIVFSSAGSNVKEYLSPFIPPNSPSSAQSNGSCSPSSDRLTSPEQNPKEAEKPSQRQLSWRVATNLIVSFKYAWQGLSYTFKTQRNFRIHVAIGTVATSLSIFLQLDSVKIAVIGLTCGLVLVMELLNTAIESVVDLTVKQTYHELAKIAKDCAAGSVLVSAIAAVLVGILLLLPPLLVKIQQFVS